MLRCVSKKAVFVTSSDCGYSKEELFELWLKFRHRSNAIEMLSDFGCMSKPEALALYYEFVERLLGPEIEFKPAPHNESDFMW